MLCTVMMVIDMKFVHISTCLTTLRSCVLVDGTVDGKDNKMKETMEVGDIMMYHFS